MRRSGQRLGLVLLVTAGAVFSTAPPSGAAIKGVVRVEGNRFTPRELNGVNVADTVYWAVPKADENEPPEPTHSLTSDDGKFPEQILNAGDAVGLTFNTPGDYLYHCKFHGGPGGVGMSGVVHVVEPAGTTTTTAGPTTTTTTAPPTTTTAPPTTTTAPPTTSTTRPSGTTPTTAPPTTPTTSTPGPSSASAAPGPAPAPASAPAPTGTTSPDKKKKAGTTTTTVDKAKAAAAAAAATTSTTVPPPDDSALVFDLPATTVTEPPTTTTVPVEVATPDEAALDAIAKNGRSGSLPVKALAVGAAGTLLAIGGYAWYHRSSRYLPA